MKKFVVTDKTGVTVLEFTAAGIAHCESKGDVWHLLDNNGAIFGMLTVSIDHQLKELS